MTRNQNLQLPTFLDLLKMEDAAYTFGRYSEPIPLYKPPEGRVHLFHHDQHDFDGKVDIDIFLKHFTQAYGMTGSGKSNTMGRLCEQLLLRGVKICIIDIKGEYLMLPQLKGFKGSCKAVRMGIQDEEMPLFESKKERNEWEYAKVQELKEMGKKLAQDYVSGISSLVLNLGGEKKEDYLPYLLGFFTELWYSRKEEKRLADEEGRDVIPNKTLIEEAKNIVNANPDPNLSDVLKQVYLSLISVIRLICTEGRSVGETMHLSSQYPTHLDSGCRSQGEVYILHKQSYPKELDLYMKMMPHSTGDSTSLKSDFQNMQKGECYFVSVGEEPRFARVMLKQTPDMAKTPDYEALYKKHGGWSDVA